MTGASCAFCSAQHTGASTVSLEFHSALTASDKAHVDAPHAVSRSALVRAASVNLSAIQRDHTDIGGAAMYRMVQENTSPEQHWSLPPQGRAGRI